MDIRVEPGREVLRGQPHVSRLQQPARLQAVVGESVAEFTLKRAGLQNTKGISTTEIIGRILEGYR